MVNIPTNLWIPAVIAPEKTLAKASKGKASLVDAAIVMALVGLVGGVIGGLSLGFIGFIAGAIGGAIGALIGSFVWNGAVWIMAKVLGGKGEFPQQYYLYSLFGAPIGLASAVIGLVPLVGGIVSGLLSLYMLWPLTVSIKQVHRLDTVKAVLAWLIPGIVLAIIAAIIGAAITAMLVAYGMSQSNGVFG